MKKKGTKAISTRGDTESTECAEKHAQFEGEIYRLKDKIEGEWRLGINIISGKSKMLPAKELRSVSPESITNNNCIQLTSKSTSIGVGSHVAFMQSTYQIVQFVSLNSVIGINEKTNESQLLPIYSLFALPPEWGNKNNSKPRDLNEVSNAAWKKMEYRLSCIRPLLEGRSRNDIVKHGEEIKVHYTTLYRWLRKYQEAGDISGLVAVRSGNRKGSTRISQEQEKVVNAVIKSYYAAGKAIIPHSIIKDVKDALTRNALSLVSDSTIRSRISKISTHERPYGPQEKREANE